MKPRAFYCTRTNWRSHTRAAENELNFTRAWPADFEDALSFLRGCVTRVGTSPVRAVLIDQALRGGRGLATLPFTCRPAGVHFDFSAAGALRPARDRRVLQQRNELLLRVEFCFKLFLKPPRPRRSRTARSDWLLGATKFPANHNLLMSVRFVPLTPEEQLRRRLPSVGLRRLLRRGGQFCFVGQHRRALASTTLELAGAWANSSAPV